MNGKNGFYGMRAWAVLIALAAALRMLPAEASVPEPVAPLASPGSYTVSYARCSGCQSDWLEERTESGHWQVVGTGPMTFTAKTPGNYYYRVAYWYYAPDPYFAYEWTDYSPQVRVVVGMSVPDVDPLETQLTYGYETRVGDANGDGRADVFIRRTLGGQPGNGTVDKLLLVRGATDRFSAVVPTATQLSVAQGWPRAAIRVTSRDFNVDGFADLLLKGVGTAVGASAVADQIIYAPGQLLAQQPLGIRAVDGALKQFAADSREYFADSSYFSANAPLQSVDYVVVYYLCDQWYYDVYFPHCGWFPYLTTIVVPDYSVFDATAVSAWQTETSIEANSTTIDQGQAAIKTAYEEMLGVSIGGRDLSGVLGERGSADEPRYRRGLELFLAVFGIFDANSAW